jgi:integrase
MSRYDAECKDYIAWTKQFKTGRRWFKRLRSKKGSKESLLVKFGCGLYRFTKFKSEELKREVTPDEIFKEYLRTAKEDLDEGLELIDIDLDLFVNWLVDNYGNKRSTAVTRHAQIKSWLKYNSRIFKGRFGTPESYSEEIPPMRMETLRKLLPALDARETFITMLLKDTGVSQAESILFDYGDIADEFESEKQFIHIHVFREKENIKYETWIGPNTIEALKMFLSIREQRGEEIAKESPLVVSKKAPYERLTPIGISQMYRRISRKTGIKISSHMLRKLFETNMSTAGIHPITLKFWMGHKVRAGRSDIEGSYIIPSKEQQLEEYMKGYPKIDINPESNQLQLAIAESKARMSSMTPEQRGEYIKALKFRDAKFTEEILRDPEIKKLLEGPADGGLPAEPSFREISEKELLAHLNSGYKIIHTLQNGHVIVEKR